MKSKDKSHGFFKRRRGGRGGEGEVRGGEGGSGKGWKGLLSGFWRQGRMRGRRGWRGKVEGRRVRGR